jgi:pimeloyl-ACP methyl ester carboxylesterase
MPLSVGYQLRTLGEGAEDGLDHTPAAHCLGDLGGDNPGLLARMGKAARSARYDVTRVVTYALFFVPRWLSVPVIQGFGSSAWDIMKRRAELAMGEKYDLTPEKRLGGVRLLMQRIRDEAKTWPKVELVLFGHSMGAIVADRILHAFPDLRFDHIVYAGAAAGIDDVRAALHPYLAREENEKTRFWSFSLSESNESGEINGPDVYERGSLLVWVDNLFERGNTVARRTFGRASNLKRFYARPEDDKIAKRVNLIEFSGVETEGLIATPSKHGHFDEPGVVNRLLEVVARGECPRGKPIPEAR